MADHPEFLTEPFAGVPEEERKVGVEVELGVVDLQNCLGVPYKGKPGVATLLRAFADEEGIGLIDPYDNLMGVDLNRGGRIVLEHGSAIEYCSPPYYTVSELDRELKSILPRLAQIAEGLGLGLLSLGTMPIRTTSGFHWTPRDYRVLMLEHFEAIGEDGRHGATVMAHTHATQATLDYTSTRDMMEMMRLGMLLSPIATALFANSPFENGRPSGSLSQRMRYWEASDSRRSGLIELLFREETTLDDLIEWSLSLPAIFFRLGDTFHSGAGKSFGQLLRDGLPLTQEDWLNHLSQLWPLVRARAHIEFRATDAPPQAAIGSVPAFWSGCLYSETARKELHALLGGIDFGQLQAGLQQALVKGLSGEFNGCNIASLSGEVLKIAGIGLQERIDGNLEEEGSLELLQPLQERLDEGRTFAEETLARWQGEWRQNASILARECSIRP